MTDKMEWLKVNPLQRHMLPTVLASGPTASFEVNGDHYIGKLSEVVSISVKAISLVKL